MHSKAGLFLEVASVFPIMMGAAFTQNNINSVVSLSRLRPKGRRGQLFVCSHVGGCF